MWALYYKLNADTHRQWIPAHAGDSLGSGFKTLYFLTPAPRIVPVALYSINTGRMEK